MAEWGDRGIFGIEAAARKYYGKSATALGPEESSRLASILPNPRKFNPLGNQKYVIHRSNLIYNIMVRRGIVVPEYEEVSEPTDNTAEPVDSATELQKPPQPSVTEEAQPKP